ncbi:MAG TPA: DUF4838 domain-containing protein [Pirellulaceae bacterium]|jgi:hypothetical protein|nr:DUF4838 domain-containing protein [Pirellulaceae bacterium]
MRETGPALLGIAKAAARLAATALLAASLLAPATTFAAEATLAEAGESKMPVVISPKASPATRAVADELARFLGKISGATFEVSEGDGTQGIVLGTIGQFPDPSLDKPLEIRGFDGREAFVIRTEPRRVRLIGATETGASHAAFAVLESLGVRRFFQAPEWEVVPSLPTLKVALDLDDRPAILARRIWYGYSLFEHEPTSRPVQDYAAWMRHNRMAQSFTINCGHAWQSVIAEEKEAFEGHPERLALVNGKRQGEQFCVSDPAVREAIVRWSLRFLEQNPTADMVSVEPSDGDGQCECENCRKLGTVSDRVFGLANEVAREVAKKHPGKLVGLYAYNEHSEPPAFELEPNVYVQLTAGFIRGRYTLDELIDLWPQKAESLGFYEYFSVWLWDFDRLPGGRAADIGYLRKQIPRYAKAGATSVDCESGDNWGPHGRGYYIASKLLWNPDADVGSLLADFYDKAFGPAAEPMRRYYERIDPGNKPLMSEHLLAQAFRDVEEASRLAADQTDVQARLDHVKQYLRYVHLRWLADRETDKAKKKELTLAALTHSYRTRYSYMNHWEAIRQSWTRQAAQEFEEPSWAFNDTSVPDKPWRVDTPVTHEETEAAFQEGLVYFQIDPIDERSFSTELVPVNLKGAGAPAESVQSYQGGVKYALYSQGEPLKVTVVTGTIAWYRDRAPARWSVTDAEEKRLAGDRLPLDGEPHVIEVPVPKAGLYWFEFDDSSAGWQIKVEPGRRVVVPLQRDHGFMHAGWMQPMHFYVPKGTKELQYYWSGGPHWVLGPDGTKLREVEASGSFVKIPVPDGADGRTWRFERLALGHLWFFNAPNYLAGSPEALLLPKDLAEADGFVEGAPNE